MMLNQGLAAPINKKPSGIKSTNSMDRRGQERDLGIPNPINYNPSQIIQDSPVKLPLAPHRSGNAAVSVRRGTSIFSPTQTLDHPPDNNPSPPPEAAVSTNIDANTSIRYRECLKNHAASMGGHVVDGCGEFMPSGDEGTPAYLRCAACDCHRNFHRREAEGEQQQQSQHYPYNPKSGNPRTPLLQSQATYSIRPHREQYHSQGLVAASTPTAIFNFGGGTAAESSSEDLSMLQTSGGEEHPVVQPSSGSRKRFRTKFSQDQKDRMQEFASKIGWRIEKQEEKEVQQFCSEVGVKRQVFKVWMHNSKQAMKKRQI